MHFVGCSDDSSLFELHITLNDVYTRKVIFSYFDLGKFYLQNILPNSKYNGA